MKCGINRYLVLFFSFLKYVSPMLSLNLSYDLDWPQTVILPQPPSAITQVGEMCFKSLVSFFFPLYSF